jgi:hypothetical protein
MKTKRLLQWRWCKPSAVQRRRAAQFVAPHNHSAPRQPPPRRLRDQAASADARAQALQQRAAQLSLALDDATRGAAEAARVAAADAARAAEAGEQARAAAVLDARLEGRRQLEEAKGRWQAERDALIERMAAERAGAELEARRAGDQQRRRLLDAVSELEAQRGHLAARLAAVLGSHSHGPEAATAATAAAPEQGGGPCLPPSGGGAALGNVSLDGAALRASAAAPSRATGVGGGGAEGGRDQGGEAGAALQRVQAEAYRRQAAALQAELEQLHRWAPQKLCAGTGNWDCTGNAPEEASHCSTLSCSRGSE